MAEEKNAVRIRNRYSPNPHKQMNYALICRSHRVLTTVTATPAVVRRWVFTIRHRYRLHLTRGRLVVGLGVQWTPARDAVAATLQLCVGHHCLIFQLLHAARAPALLLRFLSDTGITFVGVWNYRDAAMLADSGHGIRVGRLVDLRGPASDLMGCSRSASMETLAAAILGWPGMVKEEWVGRSNWADEWLSKYQVKYACQDAFLAFLMAKKLKSLELD